MTRACPHCGALLRRATATVCGRSVEVGWEPCQCEGARAERARRLEEAEEERLEAERRHRLARRERAGIPRRYLEATHPHATALLESVEEGRGLYVTGPVGSGKTHLACAAANLAVDAGRRVRFASGLAMLEEERGSFGEARDGLLPFITCDLLVLDDLGKERPSEWALEQLFRVVDGRYNAVAPVIVTSQYPRADLARRMAKGDSDTARAIVSRLCGMCRPWEVQGGDRRLAGPEAPFPDGEGASSGTAEATPQIAPDGPQGGLGGRP